MTKYIKPRKQAKIFTFIFGFMTGFVSFALIIAIVAYTAFYGLTIQHVENFTGGTIIQDGTGYSFVKTLTLSDIVSSVMKASKSEEGFSIQSLSEALGEDITIDLGAILPKDIDVELLNGYINDYTDYKRIEDVPFDKLPSVLADFVKEVTIKDIIEIAKMAKIDLEKYYEEYKLGNFDDLITYISNNADITSLKDLKALNVPSAVMDIITYARINDVIEILNGYMGEDKVYQIVDEMLEKFYLEYSLDEIKSITQSIISVFGENASVWDTLKDVNLLFNAEIKTLLNIKNEDTSVMQFLPILKKDTLADLGYVLNKYVANLKINSLENIEDIKLSTQVVFDNTDSLYVIGQGDYKDLTISAVIISEKSIFALEDVKNKTFEDFNKEEVTIFNNVKLKELVEKGIIVNKDNILDDFLDKTLAEISETEGADQITIRDILAVRTGILYNPNIYNGTITDLLNSNYMNIRISDINNFGIGFDTSENSEAAGVIAKLPKDATIRDIMNLDVNTVFKNLTVEDIITSGGKTYEGFITNLYKIKITDFFNKGLLGCFEGTGVTIGDMLSISEQTAGMLGAVKDIKLENLKEDIDKIYIGDLLSGLNVNPDFDPENPDSKKYVKDNNDSADIMLTLANYRITELVTVLSSEAKLGDILKLEKDENDKFVSENKVLLAIADFTLNDLTSSNKLSTLEIGSILGLEKDENGKYISDNKTLLAFADFTLEDFTKTNKLNTLQIGTILGLEKDEQGNYISTNGTLLAIADFTIDDFTKTNKLNSLEIGKILGLNKDENGKYTGANKTLLAIADFTIDDLAKTNKLDDLKIGDLLGLTKDENGYTGANKTILAIADFTISDLKSSDKINTLKIGELLGLNKDENGNYVSDNKTLEAIADFTITELKSAETLNSLKIGTLLGLNKDENGNFVSANKTIQAIADFTINELKMQDTLNTLKIGALLGLDKDSEGNYISTDKTLNAIANFTIEDLTKNGKLKTLKIGAILGLDKDENGKYVSDNKTLQAIAEKTLDELTADDSFDNLTIAEIVGLNKDENGKYITDNKILRAVADFTLAEFSSGSGKINTLKVGDFLDLNENPDYDSTNPDSKKYIKDNNTGSSSVIIHLANMSVMDMGSELDDIINDMEIGEVLNLNKVDGKYVGDETTSSVLLAIAGYKIGNLNQAVENDLLIGDLMGLNVNPDFTNGVAGAKKYISANNDKPVIIIKIANMTITAMQNGIEDVVNDLEIGEVLNIAKSGNAYVGDETTSKALLALAGYKIGELNDAIQNQIVIGDLIGLNINPDYTNGVTGAKKYVAANNTDCSVVIIKIANMTISEMQDNIEDTINKMEIGEVMNVKKEGNVYVGDVDTSSALLALASYKIEELDDAIQNQIMIGDFLGLEKDVNNKFVSDNKIILAIAEYKLGDFEDKMAELKVGDILGLNLNPDYDSSDPDSQKYIRANNSSYSPIVIKISNMFINEIGSGLDSVVNNMTLGEVLNIDVTSPSTSKALIALSGYKIGNLNNAIQNEIKIGDLLGLEKSGNEFITSNKILKIVSNYKLTEFDQKINELLIGDILGLNINPDFTNGVAGATKYVGTNNTEYSPVIVKISNISVNNLDSELDNVVNDMTIGEVMNIDSMNDVTPALSAISTYKVSELNNAIQNQINIGDLLGLETDPVTGDYIAQAKILSLIAPEKLSTLDSHINDIVSELTIGDCLDLKDEHGDFIEGTPKALKTIYDTQIKDLSDKISSLIVGDVIEIDGVVYDKNTDTYTFPSDVSIITQTIYTTKVSELGDTIDNLTISQVLEYDSNSMFSKIDPDTPIDNIEDAIRDIEISELCNFGSNSMLNLLEVEGSDKVTLNNIGDAKINIGILTIQQLIDYGFITNDGGRYNNILTKTVDEILTQVNNLP